MNDFLHSDSCISLGNLVLIVPVLHSLLLLFLFFLYCHIQLCLYSLLLLQVLQRLLHFVFQLRICLEVEQMLCLVRKHILSCLHPLGMDSCCLIIFLFHIIHLFQVVQTFYVLRILQSLHLNPVHQFSCEVCFEKHLQLLLLPFCVHILLFLLHYLLFLARLIHV